MGRGLVIGVVVVLAALGVAVGVVLRDTEDTGPANAGGMTVASAMGGDGGTEGFARAMEPRPFHFPEDHGPHPDFRTEWWYWTGNLETQDGRAFGYQFTLFRSALSPEQPQRESGWGTRQVFMGHFTLTDVSAGRFHVTERFSRAAQGLAGADGAPFHVWLQDWDVRGEGTNGGTWPMHLRAQGDGVTLELTLDEGKPPVLQGDKGLSQKGPERGNASYYYSMPRMPSRGTVSVDGQTVQVKGESWMDREWSTSALSGDQVGWDWFALQLSDGSELMLYQLRKKDGSKDAFSAGTYVPTTGEAVHLGAEDMKLEPRDTWKSPRGGEYPAGWRVQVPKVSLALTVTPKLPDQELPVLVRYWEGAVTVDGTREGQPVQGRGYLEMTGYADAPRSDETVRSRTP
ncbi:lipocalin-like domain-containing protein [Corallococcus sp. AS-1-12]|uniref:lipocalin-like domain-containing protein n=1 Tax=Corallococcus sp. AS-1-12 TaxID=2874598 RepID=UPI001CBF6422|nr:lipocalin-like domain-containing protein [Corallococcus sp. AS-1-12]MBZ4332341.1 carotenoid 1,2-hydratase [Corallococcus sp. AS-1-12]